MGLGHCGVHHHGSTRSLKPKLLRVPLLGAVAVAFHCTTCQIGISKKLSGQVVSQSVVAIKEDQFGATSASLRRAQGLRFMGGVK